MDLKLRFGIHYSLCSFKLIITFEISLHFYCTYYQIYGITRSFMESASYISTLVQTLSIPSDSLCPSSIYQFKICKTLWIFKDYGSFCEWNQLLQYSCCLLAFLSVNWWNILKPKKTREIIWQDTDLSIYISVLLLPFSDFNCHVCSFR